jgi:hypothetical protein
MGQIQESLVECRKGNHKLIVIYQDYANDENKPTVRWCTVCGSVVVDLDYDNRTNPGDIMKMKTPSIIQEIDKDGKEKSTG